MRRKKNNIKLDKYDRHFLIHMLSEEQIELISNRCTLIIERNLIGINT